MINNGIDRKLNLRPFDTNMGVQNDTKVRFGLGLIPKCFKILRRFFNAWAFTNDLVLPTEPSFIALLLYAP